MTPEERALMYDLAKRIAEEKDPATFNKLIVQLNDLLERKEERLESDRKPKE